MANDHRQAFGGERHSTTRHGGSPTVGELQWELELLGNERRRRTIRMLEDDDADTYDRHEIARRIATAEVDADAPDDRFVRRVECALHHKHLPMLDEYGVVDYAPEAGVATYSPSRQVERRVLATVEC